MNVIIATLTRIALVSLMIVITTGPAPAQSARKAVNRIASSAVNNATNSAVQTANQSASSQSGGTQGVSMLPNVSTSSVDLNTCDMDFIGGKSRPSSGGGGGGGGGGSDPGSGTGQENYPPSPGPGYQPMTQHGEFVGWYSPDEVALSQTDFPAALVSILKSDRYYGGIEGAASILYEIGMISSPFAFDEASAFLGK